MDGVFNLILQMGLKYLWLLFVTWHPAEEFPPIEGTLVSSQTCVKANPSFLLCISLHEVQQKQVWMNVKLGHGCFGLSVCCWIYSVLRAFLAGYFGIVQLRKHVLP